MPGVMIILFQYNGLSYERDQAIVKWHLGPVVKDIMDNASRGR